MGSKNVLKTNLLFSQNSSGECVCFLVSQNHSTSENNKLLAFVYANSKRGSFGFYIDAPRRVEMAR